VTASRDAERDAIKAAMDRLLNGTPAASTGALSVLQLAAEAGVKRWVLTHKHPDLKAEFERRRTASNGIPAAFQNLQARITDLEDTCQRLRAGKAELTERVAVYAQVIHELTTELSRLREQLAGTDNVIQLPTGPLTVRSPR
jgi:septal ring factor EnvC (AmiA/AmiB activator)